MLPFFLSDGSNPRKTDSRWYRWVKILSASNDICGGNALNHASINDTIAQLQTKVWATAEGQSWVGYGRRDRESEWDRVADILDALLAMCGGAARNAHRRTDTLRILEQKILATVSHQTYNG